MESLNTSSSETRTLSSEDIKVGLEKSAADEALSVLEGEVESSL